jgi:hypothetical protein
MTTEPVPALAAVPFAGGSGVDAVMAAAVGAMRAAGLRVGGAVQEEERMPDGCCGPMHLAGLGDGSRVQISQNLGRQSRGCRLDPQALAEAAAGLAASVDAGGLDVLVLNRFGKAEAEGGGLRSVIERAIESGLPVLIAVREDFLPAWEAFHGGLAGALPADAARIAEWALAATGRQVAA